MDQMEAAGLPGPMTLGGTRLPLVGRARVYACGITPYDVTHVGHAAAFVWVDTLARVLRECGAEVIICRNVTDVDDVLLAAADRAGSPYDRFAAIQQFYFDRDMAALGVGQPALQPRRNPRNLPSRRSSSLISPTTAGSPDLAPLLEAGDRLHRNLLADPFPAFAQSGTGARARGNL